MKLKSSFLSLLVLSPIIGFAQSVPQADTSNDEVIALSEFQVTGETDRGYVATQAAGATRTKTPLIELAHTVNVLNKELIRDTGSLKFWDSARYISGVTGGDQRIDGGSSPAFFSLRGFGVTSQRDGLNSTFAPTKREMSGYERVEIVKGASAVQTGSSAAGGILNFVAKRPFFRNEAELMAFADTYGALRGSIDINRVLHDSSSVKAAVRVVGTVEDSTSFMDFAFRKLQFGQVGFNFQLGANTTLMLRFESQQEKALDGIGIPYVFFNSTSPTPRMMNLPIGFYRGEPDTDYKKAIINTLDLQVEHHINSNWSTNFLGYIAKAWADRAESFFFAPTGNVITAWPRGLQIITDLGKGGAAEWNVVGNFEAGPARHQLLMGVSTLYSTSDGTNQRWNYAGSFNPLEPVYGVQPLGPRTINQSTLGSNTNVGVYVQETARLFQERLILGAGLRWDYSNIDTTNRISGVTTSLNSYKTSPRYSALYRVTDRLSVYASYNESFLPAPGGTNIAGERFKPQEAEQHEAGVKFDLIEGKFGGNVAVFQLEQGNAVTSDRNNPGFPVQGGIVMSNGYETDLYWSPVRNWQLIGGFSRFKFRRNSEIEQTPLVPPRLEADFQTRVTLWTKYEIATGSFKNLALGLGVIHEGTRFGDPDRRFTVPGYVVFNGLVSYNFKNIKVAVNIENLFDKRYVQRIEGERMYNPGPPRTASFTVSAKF